MNLAAGTALTIMMMSRKDWCLEAIITSPVGGLPRISVRSPTIQCSEKRTQLQNAMAAARAPRALSNAQGKNTIPITAIATYICTLKSSERSHWTPYLMADPAVSAAPRPVSQDTRYRRIVPE